MLKIVAELMEKNINGFEVRTGSTMSMGFKTEEKLMNALTEGTKIKFGNSFKESLIKMGFKEKDIFRIDVYLKDEENMKLT